MGWQHTPDLFTEAELTNKVNEMWGESVGGSIDWLWSRIRPKQFTDLVNKRILMYHQDEHEASERTTIVESIRMVCYKDHYNEMMRIVNEATPLCP